MINNANNNRNIDKIITCFICDFPIKNATMCPKCQKLACNKCIANYAIKHKTCPNCKNQISLNDLIAISFMNDIADYVSRSTDEICDVHNLSKMYFCKNCNFAMCSDCAMLNNNHKNHIIRKLHDLYNDDVSQLNSLIRSLNKKSAQYVNMIKSIDKINQSVDEYVYAKNEEIKSMLDAMRTNISDKAQDIKAKLNYCKQNMKDKVEAINSRIEDIKKKISKLTKSELIAKYKELIIANTFNDKIDNDVYDRISNMNVAYEISKEIIPQYERYFYYKCSIQSKKSLSQWYDYYEMKMRIKVLNENNSHIGTFIDYKGEKQNLILIIEMKQMNTKTYNYAKENKYTFTEGDCVGYSKYYSIDKLHKDGYINAKGEIALRFSVKPITYRELNTIIEKYYQSNNNKRNDIKHRNRSNDTPKVKHNKEVKSVKKKKTQIIIDLSDKDKDNANIGIGNLSLSTIQNDSNIFYNDNNISLTLDNETKVNHPINNTSSINNVYPKNSLNKLLNKNNLNDYFNTILPKTRNVSSNNNLFMVYPENKFTFNKKL